jgi:hypothetical protein
MERSGKQRTYVGTKTETYRIVVDGEFSERYATA